MPAPEAGHRVPRRIAVITPNWLGDAVMALPAINLLCRAEGTAVSLVSSPYTARVFYRQPGVADLWVDPPGGRLARLLHRTRALHALSPCTTVVMPPSFSSVLPPWFAGVPERVGFRADGRGAWLTRSLPMPPRNVHLTRWYASLTTAAMGHPATPGELPTARLHVSDKDREAVQARPGLRDEYVVVVPGAAYGPAKSWPLERYRTLCAQLARQTRVVLAGSAKDQPGCAEIARKVPGVHSVAGTTTLGELFALIEGARALVANDSGAPHAAAALGVPCVVLFGSTSPAWTAPVGAFVQVLQHRVHCNPCFRRTCPTQLECFNGIAVDEVLSAVHAALARNAVR